MDQQQDEISDIRAKLASIYGAECFENKTWDTFKTIPENLATVEALRKISFEDPFGAYIFGNPGVGKTHMLMALMNQFLDMKAESIFNKLQGTTAFGPSGRAYFVKACAYIDAVRGEKFKVKELALNASTLFLDDIGTLSKTDWGLDQMLYLLDVRHDRGLQTFITSNLSTEDLVSHSGARLASRVCGMTVALKIFGNDQRKEIMKGRLGELIRR